MADDLANQFVADIEGIMVDGDFDPALDALMSDRIIEAWRANSPEDTRAYKDSIQVIASAEAGRGMVAALDEAANIIEYGSEDTPEFAPLARTIEQLNREAAQS